MKITVLSGSPKGEVSVTMQYVRYLAKKFENHEFVIHHISRDIKKIEKDPSLFQAVIGDIRSSAAVIWAFPLYYCLVPSQYKRFIELIEEKKAVSAFKGKYAAVITTSIHFFDHTAHDYMRAVCEDLSMVYAAYHSPDMYDLVHRLGRLSLIKFGEQFFHAVEQKVPAGRAYPALKPVKTFYRPGKAGKKTDQGDTKVLILNDLRDGDKNLDGMVNRLAASFKIEPEIINLRDLDIKGGCLGCIQCGYDNSCVYGSGDDYIAFFNEKVRKADIIFMCGTVVDRYLSSKWKEFFDRSFFNNHVPVYAGKQVGFLISGNFSGLPFVREIFQAYLEMMNANLVDTVTDEGGDSRQIDALIDSMADKAVRYSKENYIRPYTFLALGGKKIFRDDVFTRLKFPFVADYRFYKKAGIFDFPQKNRRARIMGSLLTFMAKIPAFREEIYKRRMKREMIAPLKKAVERD